MTAGAVTLLAVMALTGTAAASQLSATTPAGETGSYLTFTAAPGETNQFRLDAADAALRLRDTRLTLTSTAPGCTEDRDLPSWLCDMSGYAGIFIDFGDGGDEIYNTTSYAGRIVANGGPGGDRLIGGAGTQIYEGGPGDDVLSGGPLADHLAGGAGADRVNGYSGNDSMLGGRGADSMDGIMGNDRVRGGGGADVLVGNSGRDSLEGGPGRDRLDGGLGNDRLRGGAGSDQIVSASRPLNTAQGRDLVDCGPGRDFAMVDRADRVRHCERVVFQDQR